MSKSCCISFPFTVPPFLFLLRGLYVSLPNENRSHHMEIFDSFTHSAAVRAQPVGKENSDRKKSSSQRARDREKNIVLPLWAKKENWSVFCWKIKWKRLTVTKLKQLKWYKSDLAPFNARQDPINKLKVKEISTSEYKFCANTSQLRPELVNVLV